jgi:signal transduction histidine kinase/ActR/RegA family two-component response regulator
LLPEPTLNPVITIKRIRQVRIQMAVSLAAILALVWSALFFELGRSHHSLMREAESSNVFQAQAFAENTLSTIKRVNEMLLDLRAYWAGDVTMFSTLVQRRKEHLSDIAFQVAIIDAEGYLAYSNLAAPNERTFLGEREHFRVHLDASQSGNVDRLFISKPLKGKVSGKWSIQFTRPIYLNEKFAGVIVVSVSPDSFAAFHQKLQLGTQGNTLMAMSSGEVMARYPDSGSMLGQKISGSPWVGADANPVGTYQRVSQLDGLPRTYGYYRLADYGLNFVVGQTVDEILAPYRQHRTNMIGVALVISLLMVTMFGLLYRSFVRRSAVEQQLHDSQGMLRSAVDTIGEAFVVYDREDRLAYFNEQYREVYRSSADLLVTGNRFEDIIRAGAERGQYKEAIGHVDEWVAQRMVSHRQGNTDIVQQLGNGRWIRIRERMTPEGFIVGFRIDITEFVEARDAAEASNRAKSQFLATMSHEIRTPMNGILGMAQLLLMPDLKQEERVEFARTIVNSGKSLLTLLNDILDLSKIEAGKLQLQEAECDPAQLIADAAHLFVEQAQQKGVTVDSSWEGEPLQDCRADSSRVRQMLTNLVSNALKFTDQGRVKVTGRCVAREKDFAVLEFSVVDSGIGIAEDKLPLLFQPFSQVDSSNTRKYGGTGLGLSIVRTLAQLMGGEVGVESTPGLGSRFWFRIRVGLEPVAVTVTAPAVQSLPISEVAEKSALVRRRILVAEDNPTNLQVVSVILGKRGFQVESAINGREALTIMTNPNRPALVLMDCQMPEMDGFQATARIREWEKQNGMPRVPIVALTAGVFDDDKQRCTDSGMDDFLAKPLDIDRLDAALEKWLPVPL